MRAQQHPSRRTIVPKTRAILGQESIESKKNFWGKLDFFLIVAIYKGKHILYLSYEPLFTRGKLSPDLHILKKLSLWRGVVGPSFRQSRTLCCPTEFLPVTCVDMHLNGFTCVYRHLNAFTGIYRLLQAFTSIHMPCKLSSFQDLVVGLFFVKLRSRSHSWSHSRSHYSRSHSRSKVRSRSSPGQVLFRS